MLTITPARGAHDSHLLVHWISGGGIGYNALASRVAYGE